MENINTNQDYQQLNQEQKSLKKARQNTFLAGSIIWFIYGTIIAFVSAIVTLFVIKNTKTYEMLTTNYIFMIIFSCVTFIAITIEFFVGPKMNFWLQLFVVTISMIGIGVVVLSVGLFNLVLAFSPGDNVNSTLVLIKILSIILAPLLLMGLFGILGMYDLIKVNVWTIASIIFAIGFFFIFFLSFFVFNSWIRALFPALGFMLMLCYMALDWFCITKINKAYNMTIQRDDMLKKEMFKLSLYFGFRLSFDYIYMLIYLIQIFKN